MRRIWIKGIGGNYKAGGSQYQLSGTYTGKSVTVPENLDDHVVCYCAPKANGFDKNGKYVCDNNTNMILDCGNIVLEYDSYNHNRVEKIKAIINNELALLGGEIQEGVFYRGTNNKEEIDLLKSGKIRPSLNHLTGEAEDGLSVFPKVEYASHTYTYKVTGDIIGVGADGEPLLDVKTVRAASELHPTEHYLSQSNSMRIKGEKLFIKKYSWSQDQLNSAKKGFTKNKKQL